MSPLIAPCLIAGSVYAMGWLAFVPFVWRRLRKDWIRDYGAAHLDAEYVRVMHLKTALRASTLWPAYLLVLAVNGALALYVQIEDLHNWALSVLKRGRS